MEKRFLIFIVVSFLILTGWQLMMAKFYPDTPSKPQPNATSTPTAGNAQTTPNPAGTPGSTTSTDPAAPTSTPETTATNPATTPAGVTDPATANPAVANVAPRQIKVDTPYWHAIFSNRGGVITSMSIKRLPSGREVKAGDYGQLELVSQDGLQRIGAPLRLEVAQTPDLTKQLNESYYAVDADGDTIQLQPGEQKDLVFRYQDGKGLTVEKRLHFYGDRYLFDLTVDAVQKETPLAASILIGPNFGDQSTKVFDTYVNTPPQTIIEHGSNKVTFVTGSELEHRSAPPDPERAINESVNWVAAADHYFAMAVVPSAPLQKARVRNDFYKETVEGKEVYKHLLSVETPIVNKQPYTVFVGPKDRQLLEDVSKERLNGRADLGEMINYGMFSFLIKPLVPVLGILLMSFYKLTHNYGWSIIFVTLIINLLFFPLKWKSSVAMKRAMKLQPKMKELQEKMKKLKKDDPRTQELQLEQMRLMKEGNPLSGCLPLLIQMPLFWAIYIYLSISVDVRHMPFILWIKDLAAPDHTWILPIIMTVSMMASTALTPTPNSGDPSQKMQKIMTAYIMPVVFLLLFFSKAPSGLVLYWMFSNIIGVLMQLVINKMTTEPPADPANPAGPNKDKDKLEKKTGNKSTQTGDLANV